MKKVTPDYIANSTHTACNRAGVEENWSLHQTLRMHDVIVIYVGAFVELTRGQPLEDIWIASRIKTSGSIALIQYVPPLGIQIFSISLIN